MSVAWTPLLHSIIVTELPEREYADSVARLITQLNGAPVIKLVEALGPFLTGDDDAQRARATAVLSEVVEAVPAAAGTQGEVAHLAQFFTSRLTDWPAVRGALRGCLALLTRRSIPAAAVEGKPAPGPEPGALAALSEPDAVEMLLTCVGHVFIRALAQPDRMLALRLLTAAMQRYGQALVTANLDLLDYLISSVDGEKDPRCLLLSFEAVQALLALYHQQPQTSLCHDRLEESAEELFEVLACYFPVTFTPPPGDPNRITRAELAAGLEASLAAEPLFAPHLVPLAMEKLSSTLRQAKLDSLSLLGACAASWGPAPLASHVSTIWAALRAELAAPAAEGLLPADLLGADELAGAAAACLMGCVAAFQAACSDASGPAGASLADAVLADPSVHDMLACIRAPGQDAARHRRSALRAKAGARAAAALCRAGGAAAARALSQLLPPLLAATSGSPAGGSSWQAQCLAWGAITDLLEAAALAPASEVAARAAPALDGALLQQVLTAAAAALAATAAEQAAAAMEEDGSAADTTQQQQQGQGELWPLHPADCTQEQATAQQLAALATVFADPRLAGALQLQQVEAAVSAILQLLTAPGAAGAAPAAGSSSQAQQQAAVAALTALAGSSHAGVLADRALPQLVAVAVQQQSAAAALASLQALAAASSSLHSEIVGELDRAIQQQLPAVADTSSDSNSSSTALLQQLLQAATGIVAASAAGPEGAAGAGALLLGRHLFDAVMQLPAHAAAAADAALQTACAELAYHAMRVAPADQQQPLAAAAAEALLQQQGQQQLAGVQAAVCCALLVPLRHDTVQALPAGRPAALVQQLVQLSLAAQQQREGGPIEHWAALAAAALLNKCGADAKGLATCASQLLQQQLYPACGLAAADGAASDPPAAGAPTAWSCLAAVTQGLAMRGRQEADAIVSCVLGWLEAAAPHWQQQQQAEAAAESQAAAAAGARAAAQFLGAVLDGSSVNGGSTGVGLGKLSYATARPLWQQRLYTTASTQLLALLQRSLQSSGGSSSEQPAGGEGQPQPASPLLLLALGHLVRAAPGGALQQDQKRTLPWKLQCLAALQQGPLADGDLLLALLLLVSDFLTKDAGKQQAAAELLPRLVPVLLDLAAYRPLPAVRETALQCLLLLVELPYTALHPYRRQVARALAAAVDDGRRAVRLQAARCRQAWTA